jgi:hypothetical protein
MTKRTYPWLLAPVAAATLPSTSPLPSRDADLPVAKKSRLTVPFSANPEKYVTKSASSDAEEAVRPADADIEADPMTALQSNASAIRALPFVSPLLEYGRELTGVAPMAPAPTNLQLRGLSGCHPSIYQTTGFTGTSLADQVNIQQTLYGVNGHASTAVRDPVQATSPRSNGWNPWGSTWHPSHSLLFPTTGFMDMSTADPFNILQIRNGLNGYASNAAGGLLQTTTPCCNGLSSQNSAWHPTVILATGTTGTWLAGQDNIIPAKQNGTNGYSSLALDPGQLTTSLCQNRLYKAMGTPVETTGGSRRWTTGEVDIEWTTQHQGKWTAEEDRMLLHAVNRFSGTRWKQIAALIPGRTKKQCWNRWQYTSDPSVVRITERTGKWLTEEDDKLMAAVKKYDGKSWDSIAALVPSRTKRQCMDKWHKCKSG